MRATIVSLESNDFSPEAEHAARDPEDDLGWFSVRVGAEGVAGTSDFQVVVCTPRAIPRAKFREKKKFTGIVVERYDPKSARHAVREKIESIDAASYDDIVQRLVADMYWEYEDYKR